MGFYYDKNGDQERMISKFDKVNRRNKEMIDQNHPNFDPLTLPLAEQIKYFEAKWEKERVAKVNEALKPKEQTKRYTIYK
jgi:hypothetical protein